MMKLIPDWGARSPRLDRLLVADARIATARPGPWSATTPARAENRSGWPAAAC
jgi:hypothetical protein